MERTLDIGDSIKVVDETGNLRDGLVTNHWHDGRRTLKEGECPTINVAFISADPAKNDPFGRQVERLSSCSHKTTTNAPGRYWFFADEGRKE